MSARVGYKAITLPIIGTKIRVKRVSTNGCKNKLAIINGEESNIFVALFDEQDVDFEIIVDNRENERGIRLKIAINNEKHSFYIRPNISTTLRALETNGRKLHFLSQNTNEGKVLVAKNAVLNAMSYEESAVSVSRIEFKVEVEVIKDKINIPSKILKWEKFVVFVKYGSKRYGFLIDKNKTVEELMTDIENRLYILSHNQTLELNGKQLKGRDSLRNVGVKVGTELTLYKQSEEIGLPYIQLYISLKEKVIDLSNFTTIPTIKELKLKIEEKESIPVYQMKFKFEGNQVKDERNLIDYNIENKSNIDLVLRRRCRADYSSDERQNLNDNNSNEIIVIFINHEMERLEFEITGNSQVLSLKRKIRDRLQIPICDQLLSLNHKPLQDCVNFFECGVKDHSELNLLKQIKLENECQIIEFFVKTLNGNPMTIRDFSKYATVKELKCKIQDTEGIPPDQQRLFFNDEQLEDEHTFHCYDIQCQSTVLIVLDLRGGGCGCGLTDCEYCNKLADICTHKSSTDNKINERSNRDNQYGERGVVCFGERSDQKFKTYSGFVRDSDFDIKPFVLEMRMDSKYSLNCN